MSWTVPARALPSVGGGGSGLVQRWQAGAEFARGFRGVVRLRDRANHDDALRAMQVFYTVRSERQLMEQTRYNLLFRWFIGLAMDDAVWMPTVFTKNRERLIEHDA